MSSLYDPDPRALLKESPWGNAFLTQRDVALLVPVNYHTGPMASLTAACFAHHQYEDKAFIKCLSNLLAAGFKRYVVDVYWDPMRFVWSLCPVEVPDVIPEPGSPSPVVTVSPRRMEGLEGLQNTVQSSPTVKEDSVLSLPPARNGKVLTRQDGSTSLPGSGSTSSSTTTVFPGVTSASSQSPTTTSSSTSSATPSSISSTNINGNQVFQIGDYKCTRAISLGIFTDVLDKYFEKSDVTTDAAVTYLVLNIHAVAPFASPDAPAQQPKGDQMPSGNNLISNFMKSNLEDKMYTPFKLQEDRNNLNDSWLEVQTSNLPIRGYYQISSDKNDRVVTANGWPTEALMEFKEFHRLIAGFGSIDPQMSQYNIRADKNTIFGPNEIFSFHNTASTSSGKITSGCLFSPSSTAITPSTNASWATALAPLSQTSNPALANLSTCGFSPLLNTSLSNQTADQNPLSYLAFTASTFWSWAPGQPTNITDPDNADEAKVYPNRCAAISASPEFSDGYPGRWRTVDCRTKRRVVCQDIDVPYRWAVSEERVGYFDGGKVCGKYMIPGDNNTNEKDAGAGAATVYKFSVPHTALENAHLLQTLRLLALDPSSDPDHHDDKDKHEAFYLNINSVDTPNCWALGINTACPYLSDSADRMRVVVVPTVAAVIIFVLAALTFFVKCAANRREDLRGRRRREGGWEYEGIPS